MLRRYIFSLILFTTLFSNYIGSWINLQNFPFGAILRDSFIIVFIIMHFKKEYICYWNNKDIQILIIYFLLLMVTLFSFLNSSSFLVSLMGARVYILYTLLFLVLYKSKFIENNSEYVEINLLTFFLIASVIGLIDFFTFGEFSSILGYKAENLYQNLILINSFEDRIRLTGGFSGALDFSYFLTLSIVLTLNNMLKGIKYKILNNLVFICSFFAIIFTLTRGAIFVTFLLILLFLIFKFHYKISKSFIIYIFFAILLSGIFIGFNLDLIDTLFSRFLNTDASSSESTNTRYLMASNSIDYLLNHPEGIGLGTQGSGYLISAQDNRINTDNYYFWIALEIGILGLLCNTWFYIILLKDSTKSMLKLKYPQFGLFLVFCISSLVSSSFISALVLIYFMCISLLVKTR